MLCAAGLAAAVGWLQRHQAAGGEGPTCRAVWLRSSAAAAPSGSSENGKRVVLVATGSVASVKVPQLACMLCFDVAAEVVILLTDAAEAMAGRVARRYAPAPVLAEFEALQAAGRVRILRDADEWEGYADVTGDLVVHIELRKWADAAVVAPCSANTLAKVALGLCDNLATSFVRAWNPEKPIVFAPAMNTLMWEHPATAQHLRTLEAWGYGIVPPVSKLLACGDRGRGALAEPGEIVVALERALAESRCVRPPASEDRRRDGHGAWERLGFAEWEPGARGGGSAAVSG